MQVWFHGPGKSLLPPLLAFFVALAGFSAISPMRHVPGVADVPALSQALAGKTILIDPGHGGPDPGIAINGIHEKNLVLQISFRLKELLQKAGFRVILTRETDRDLSEAEAGAKLGRRKNNDLQVRAEMPEKVGADLFLSIHINGLGSPQWDGTQVFFHPDGNPGGRVLAKILQEELLKVSHSKRLDRPAELNQLILHYAPCPSATAELGFLSNPTERQILQDPAYQAKLAWGLYAGIVRFMTEAPQDGR